MITDSETNIIYFSDLLRTKIEFAETCSRITDVLDKLGIVYKFLNGTKDIWARDFMPIQINDTKYIEYRYDPNYLQGHWKGCRELKTYPDIVCDSLKLATEKSDIIMDGGNFVKSSDCIILTDKIVNENRLSYSKNELIEKLRKTFQVEKVILIPWFKKEKYGHSDGVVRFVDNETVLISHYFKKDNVMLYRLKAGGLKTEFLDFKEKKRDKRSWAYVNFLQTKDLILLPKFDIDEDLQAYEQIKYYYPEYKERIFQINMTDVVKFGGALNCITWTTKE